MSTEKPPGYDPKTGYDAANPRKRATFFESSQVAVKGEPWTKMGLRERCKVWSEDTATAMGMSGVVYLIVIIKLVMWATFYRYAVQDRTQSVFSDLNAKRFILYNVIGDVLGTNSTWGILGMRMDIAAPFVTWWNFITPGTLTVPLLPGIPGVRSKALVAQYLVYVALLLRALFSAEIGFDVMWPPLLVLAIIVPQDLNIYMACRGEHYAYVMVCMLFTQQEFIFGWTCVQVTLWFGAGISKIGPWFKYVTAAMMPNTLLLRPFPWVVNMIHQSSTDPSPTLLCSVISHFGTVTELIMGFGCIYYPVYFVPLTVCFHLYIFSMFPFASVMEWNVLCILSCVYLFHHHSFAWPAHVNPLLLAFLALVLVVIPVLGNIFPKHVPFLLSYRPYAGNWRFSFTVLTDKSVDKLKRIKSYSSPLVSDQAKTNPDPNVSLQWDWNILASHLVFPHYRPFLPITEALQKKHNWDDNEMHMLQQEGFLNAIYGWSLGLGFYLRPAHFKAMQDICQFDKGECYTIVVEPCSILNRNSEWWCVDHAEPDKKVYHGSCQYHQLEEWGLFGMPISAINNLASKQD